jgi:flagellar motor switch protein FliN
VNNAKEITMTASVVNRIELPALGGAEVDDRSAAVGERLDLVGHVKVRLTVCLGGAEISIGKLFSLTPQDVIELDREVDAPVDIRLNERIIARGSLVAVGDNFGVRITEIEREP